MLRYSNRRSYFLINSAILKLCDLSCVGTRAILSTPGSSFIVFWDVRMIFLNRSSSVSPTSIISSSWLSSAMSSWKVSPLIICFGEHVGLCGVVPSLSAISSSCFGFISLWVWRWVLRLDLWLKLRWQMGHLWGASSKWRILWTAKVRFWQKPFPQSSHLNGFSFEWMYRWSLN